MPRMFFDFLASRCSSGMMGMEIGEQCKKGEREGRCGMVRYGKVCGVDELKKGEGGGSLNKGTKNVHVSELCGRKRRVFWVVWRKEEEKGADQSKTRAS